MKHDFRSHRHYDEKFEVGEDRILNDSTRRALMMAEVVTLSTSMQLRVLAKAVEHWGSGPYTKPLGSEGADDLLAVKDALIALSEDLRIATSAINEAPELGPAVSSSE